MAILRNSITALLPLALSACYTDFDPKLDTKPVLCLNSLITAGEPIEVEVSHTWIYTDRDAEKNHSVRDAEVKIYADGIQVSGDYLPKEGDLIRIEAFSPTYGYAEAEVAVPLAVAPSDVTYGETIRSSYWTDTPGWGLTGNILFNINVSIEVATSAERDRFYRIGYKKYPSGATDYAQPDDPEDEDDYNYRLMSQTFSQGSFRTPDPIFSEYINNFEEIMGYEPVYESAFFSDRSFDGASRPIHIQFEGCGYTMSGLTSDEEVMNCGYLVTLYSISDSYFNWALYWWQQYDGIIGEFSELGLADPIRGYSNVSTGAGVVAAQSSVTVRIDIKDFLEKTIGR